MNKQLFKQLIENKTFEEFRRVVIANIEKGILDYKSGSKADKTIASDIKGFETAIKYVNETMNSLKNIGEMEKRKDIKLI